MTKISLAVVSAALAIGMAAPASAGVNDPEVIIYRFPGVLDDAGADNAGVATVFACTNFSGATETIRYVTRGPGGVLQTNFNQTIPHLETVVTSTHHVIAYNNNSLQTGQVARGTTAIAATSTNIICTAMIISASAQLPTGIALRGIRFSPVPGSEE